MGVITNLAIERGPHIVVFMGFNHKLTYNFPILFGPWLLDVFAVFPRKSPGGVILHILLSGFLPFLGHLVQRCISDLLAGASQ